MLRFFALLLLALIFWMLLSRLLAYLAPAPPRDRRGAGARGVGRRPAEQLVRCAACGVRVPESRALAAAGGVYCSPSCRRRAYRDTA